MASSAAFTAPSLSQSSTLAPSSTAADAVPKDSAQTTYTPPPYTLFPPFYTLQPNTTTLTRQLALWTSHITAYCSHPHPTTNPTTSGRSKIFRLNLSTPPLHLFTHPTLPRCLPPTAIRTILTHMATPAGGHTAEFLPPPSRNEASNSVYIWWKSPGEWADAVYAWVEGTGQKGAVLTVFELLEDAGEGGRGREWVGMDEGMLKRVLGVLVKRGRAQIFAAGEGGGEGVKFF